MDLNKLLTVGKITREVKIEGGVFYMETPPIDRLTGEDPFMNIAQFIVKIDDEDYTTPDKKQQLKNFLAQLQAAVFGKLIDICAEMNLAQRTEVDGLFSKKE